MYNKYPYFHALLSWLDSFLENISITLYERYASFISSSLIFSHLNLELAHFLLIYYLLYEEIYTCIAALDELQSVLQFQVIKVFSHDYCSSANIKRREIKGDGSGLSTSTSGQ